MMNSSSPSLNPSIEAAEKRFRLRRMVEARAPPAEIDSALVDLVENVVKKNNLAGWFKDWRALEAETIPKLKSYQKLEEEMLAETAKKTRELTAGLEDARENRGQVEIMDAQLELASHAVMSGTPEEALGYWNAIDFKNLTSGKKIDSFMERARLGLMWDNAKMMKESLAEADRLLETGGDWDRRNRLKIYHGVYAMMNRDMERASREFLSSLATFTSDEVFSYERMIFYAVVTSVVALTRVQSKEKLVDAPEVVAALDAAGRGAGEGAAGRAAGDLHAAGALLTSLYECRYRDFMECLVRISSVVEGDFYLSRHARWYLREIRVRAYAQFLASYRSVKLVSMAKAFGVSVEFLDGELSKFIALKRLAAKIDKVGGVIETMQPDAVNAKYQQVIRQGDALLNRIQKLSRAINV